MKFKLNSYSIFVLALIIFLAPQSSGKAQTLMNGGAIYEAEEEFFNEEEYAGSITEEGYLSKNASIQAINQEAILAASFGTHNNNNTYFFTSSGTMQALDGESYGTALWTSILQNKESAIITEFEALMKEDFKSLQFSGDLDTSKGQNFWVDQFQETVYGNKEQYTYFRISTGAQNYYIRVDKNNVAQVNMTKTKIDQYKDAVKYGLLAASVKASYNVYSLYANNLTTLNEVVKREAVNNNSVTSQQTQIARDTFQTVIQTNSNVGYTAQYFLNPFFGKMRFIDVMETGSNVADYNLWSKYLNSLKLIHVSGNKLMFVLNDTYYNFLTERDNNPFLTPLNNISGLATKGMLEYTSKHNIKSLPSNLTDSSLYLLSIGQLDKEADVDRYKLSAEEGVDINLKYKYSVNTGMVYKETQLGTFVPAFPLTDLDLNETKVQMYNKVVDGVKLGGILPLEYKEAIYNPSKGHLYYTGRTLHLSGAFSSNLRFITPNTGLLEVTGTNSSRQGVTLAEYAFPSKNAYKGIEGHAKLATPSKLSFNTQLKEPLTGSEAGFFLFRNNAYADDVKLKEWLASEEARTKANVSADELLVLITGKIQLDDTELTYDDFLRLQEINEQLEGTWQGFLVKAIVILSAAIGWFIVIYAITLVLLFCLDMVNPFFSASTFSIATFNRMVGATNKYDREFLKASDGSKYVVGWGSLVVLVSIMTFVGILFIIFNPILDLTLWFWDKYYVVTSTGGE